MMRQTVPLRLSGAALVLAFAFAIVVAGCRGGGGDPSLAHRLDELEPRIYRVIEDPDRAGAMAAIVEQMAAIAKAAEERRADAQDRLLALHQDLEATRADFEAVLRREREQSAAGDAQMLRLRMEAAALATADEWASLVL